MDKSLALTAEELSFLTQFIVESDAIESIEDDPNLVRKQLMNGKKEGHVGALLLLRSLAKDRKPLRHRIIQQVQGLITAEQHTKPGGEKLPAEYVGKYRTVGVQVGGRVCPHPEFVLMFMDNWMKKVRDYQVESDSPTERNLERTAELHWNYEWIHPFADGNGRSGRAIAYYMMLYYGLKPFVFTASDRRATYYPAFKSAKHMKEYFKQKSEIK